MAIRLTYDELASSFYFSASEGKIKNYTTLIIQGHNSDVDSAAREDIWEQGGTRTYLSSGETMSIVSTSTADTNASGTGARTVTISGLDNNYAEISETVILAGQTPVVASNTYLRVLGMEVATAGSGLTNAGVITATASTAATVQAYMTVGDSKVHQAHYTVPAGKTAYVVSATFNAVKLSGATPIINFFGYYRDSSSTTAPWIVAFENQVDTGVANQLFIDQRVFQGFPEKYDIRVAADTDTDNTLAKCRLYIVLVDQ